MNPTSPDTSVEIKQFPIQLQKGGQITVPELVQHNLNVAEGDMLTLLQVGDFVLLTVKQLQVPQLADTIIAIMENEGVSLNDLLAGVEAEREAIWRSQQQDA